MSLVVICCHSLSFVVTRCTTRCTTRCYSLYHSLSLVVIRCTSRCHSLSLDVSLVCLFINDHTKNIISKQGKWNVFLIRFLPYLCTTRIWLNFITSKVFRSSRSQMFYKIGVLENFAELTEKHLCWSYFLITLHD